MFTWVLPFTPFHMVPLKTMVELFTQYNIHTYWHTWVIYIYKQTLTHSLLSGLRFSVSFIVHFLHSGQLLPIWRHTNEPPHRHGNTMRRSRAEGVKMRNVDREKKGTFPCSKLSTLRRLQGEPTFQPLIGVRSCQRLTGDAGFRKIWLIVARTFLCSQHSISFLRAHTSPTHLINSSSNHPKICKNQSQDFSGSDLFSVRKINHETRRLF